jgi:hypothetical protein
VEIKVELISVIRNDLSKINVKRRDLTCCITGQACYIKLVKITKTKLRENRDKGDQNMLRERSRQ